MSITTTNTLHKMKIWHISDTHQLHGFLNIPDNVDMVIHSGDVSNTQQPVINSNEVLDFLEWFRNLDIKYKILVPGNHDTSIEHRMVHPGDIMGAGIMYLENASTVIDGIKFWGTPITPRFGKPGWAWNRDRDRMYKVWNSIPEDTDVVISHGPPKGILDVSINRQGKFELCGCSNMKKAMLKLQPKLCLFGHIHNYKDITNAGTVQLTGYRTIFSNGTCVEDGRFDKGIINHGNILTI